jgi:hypothetical protein
MDALSLSSSDLAVLRREAEITAGRLIRRMNLSTHDRDDLRQDLLVDVFARLKDFDPCRHRGGRRGSRCCAPLDGRYWRHPRAPRWRPRWIGCASPV